EGLALRAAQLRLARIAARRSNAERNEAAACELMAEVAQGLARLADTRLRIVERHHDRRETPAALWHKQDRGRHHAPRQLNPDRVLLYVAARFDTRFLHPGRGQQLRP